ncbi:MAG TPA: type I 3-dehydroquinate dehydratase [Candidatus Hydrogenedentes bacterium]|nr:type I 3-dehydroquinate dehydratase [Candidatus Hydrogenedentota bacterium]
MHTTKNQRSLHIGSVELGDVPRVAVTVRNGVAHSDIEQALATGIDLVELRIDLFTTQEINFVLGEVQRYADIPTIGTIRWAAEGGGWNGPEESRLKLYEAILPCVGAIDIELAAPFCAAVFDRAREANRTSIGSYHNFEGTPPLQELNDIYTSGKKQGADIIKVAASCHAIADIRTLARFTLDHTANDLIVIGMGALGRLSRIFFPALGSLITFTFLEESAAPGQLNCRDTLKYLEAFFPNRRARANMRQM